MIRDENNHLFNEVNFYMKILVVTDNRFWREALGSQKRIKCLLEYMASCGFFIKVLYVGYLYPIDKEHEADLKEYRVDAFGFRSSSEAESALAGFAAIRARFKTVVKQVLIETGRLFRGDLSFERLRLKNFRIAMREPKLRDFKSNVAREKFEGVIREFKPDVVLVEYVRLAWMLGDSEALKLNSCLLVIDTHDVQHERQQRFHEYGITHDIDITEQEEARILGLADLVIAIQQSDALKFKEMLNGTQVIVAGHPTTAKKRVCVGGKVVRIGFVGSDMAPNVHALEFLVGTVFPRIKEKYGEAVEMHVFGSVCSHAQAQWREFKVELHGYVENIERVWGEIDIAVNPVFFGGGLKIKNVEALSFGVPLITTGCGAEGIEQGAGRAFLVARDKEEFIAMLDEVIQAPRLRVQLGQEATKFAEMYFCADMVYRELLESLKNG